LKNISNYSQPDFYHFTEESLDLVSFAAEILENRNELKSAIDLGAGCGVIGIEAMLKIPSLTLMTFLELQKEFLPFIEKNLEQAEIKNGSIINLSLGQYKGSSDIIFSNPPYFIPGNGRVSSQTNRQLCRTFEIDGWEVFFEKVAEVLNPGGLIFFCIKEEEDIKNYLKAFKIEKKEKTKAANLFCLSRLDIN
jgi:tRNA1Val (adenine37-N6)-methyltransferase